MLSQSSVVGAPSSGAIASVSVSTDPEVTLSTCSSVLLLCSHARTTPAKTAQQGMGSFHPKQQLYLVGTVYFRAHPHPVILADLDRSRVGSPKSSRMDIPFAERMAELRTKAREPLVFVRSYMQFARLCLVLLNRPASRRFAVNACRTPPFQ